MTQRFAGESADGVILSPSLNTVERTEAMVASVKEGEDKAGRKVERLSYMMTSVDSNEKAARDVIRGFYFFVYQLSEVVKPKDLEPYGVKEEMLAPMKEAWKKGDVAGASRLVPEGAVDALSIAGRPDQALDRIAEYQKVGVTLPVIMPVGNVEAALQALPLGAGRS
jgi:alkanesulfonate monooxygenase SsuD/methylene tetrahydromethanopterin reductase-like flavin-dependent oxidoreductase (luciferase family)